MPTRLAVPTAAAPRLADTLALPRCDHLCHCFCRRLFYAGCNGAFFGPRSCNLQQAHIGRHAFAGLAGPALVMSSWTHVQTGTLKITATGGVRVGVSNNKRLSARGSTAVDGTEVEVNWVNATSTPPLRSYVGGAVGFVFEIPAGGVLYAYHL